MNLNRRQQLLALLAAAALAVLVGDRLLVSPALAFWKDRAERITKFQQSVEQGTLLLERETAIRTRWQNMQSNSLALDVAVAENQALSAFDQWSKESRIGVSGIRPQWRRQAPSHATLECRVDAFGSLAALTRFLFEIERSPLGLKMEVVEIASRDDRGEQLTLGLQISGLQLIPARP